MARRFLGTGQVRYIGTPYTRPIPICAGGVAVPLQFDWNAYGASSANNTINVLVSLATPDVKETLLKRISSVYIDNTNSITPMYVYAPDTQYVATAQPNSAGWYPLYTNAFDLWVIGIGFIDGQIPYTTIFVSDLFVPPYTDLEIAQTQNLYKSSPSIQAAGQLFNQGNFAVPSIGDQIINQSFLDFTTTTTLHNALPPQATGFYYIKAIATAWSAANRVTGPIDGLLILQSDNVPSAVIYQHRFMFGGASTAFIATIETGSMNMPGMDLKLSALIGYDLSLICTPDANSLGRASFNMCFTYNPLTP